MGIKFNNDLAVEEMVKAIKGSLSSHSISGKNPEASLLIEAIGTALNDLESMNYGAMSPCETYNKIVPNLEEAIEKAAKTILFET